MTEGGNGTIINGLGSTFMNKEYGQIYLFFKESLIDMNKENKNSINDNNRNKKQWKIYILNFSINQFLFDIIIILFII